MDFDIIRADKHHLAGINRLIRAAKIGSGLKKDDSLRNFWVVKNKDGKIIACAGMEFHKDAAILSYLVVDKEFRHQGIGARLIRHRLSIAAQRGFKTVALATMYYHFNFYKRRGFRTCPRKDLPENIRDYWMFTSPRYTKCAVMYKQLD